VQDAEETTYYFRCLDQPWLANDDDENNENERNVNSASVEYIIQRTLSELKITSIDPPDGEEVYVGYAPASLDLELHTEGGVDGTAFCEFSFNGETFIDFFETGGAFHRQKFSTLFNGEYNINLECNDIAENVAIATTKFEVIVDDDGPKITRVYEQPAGQLNVITNEPSECAYDHNDCNFNFDEGKKMVGTDLIHTSNLDSGLGYYVRCIDEFENPSSCLKIKGGF